MRLDGAPEPALVGFSGGADSTALLLLLKEAGWNDLLAVHFNHHLRGADADNDQHWCESFCADRHISLIVKDLYVNEVRLQGESVETAARRCRLEAWKRLVVETGRKIVFLGHHADDALEEFLLRLGRGANASGLTSLLEASYFKEGGYTVRRPLLNYRKTELEAYLRAKGVTDWRVDATNLEPCCRRNAVRHRLIPLIREIFGTDKGFRQSLCVLRDDAEALEDEAWCKPKELMDLAAWQSLPKALLQRILPEYFPDVHFSHHTVDRLYEALEKRRWRPNAPPAYVPLNPQELFNEYAVKPSDMMKVVRRRMRVSAKGLEVVKEPDEASDSWGWNWQSLPYLYWRGNDGSKWEFLAQYEEPGDYDLGEKFQFDLGAMPDGLVVSAWLHGDRICPFGLNGHHRKLQDVFSDAHVLPEKRDAWPVVRAHWKNRSEIIWVPDLVRAEIGRVDYAKDMEDDFGRHPNMLSLWARRCERPGERIGDWSLANLGQII